MIRKGIAVPVSKPSPTGPDSLEGRVTSLVGELRVISDQLLSEIAERKAAEQDLRHAKETVSALLNASPDSALLIATDGTILAANETSVLRLRRHSSGRGSKVVGLNVYDLFGGELTKTRRERNEAVIESGKPARYEDEREGQWFDNSIYPVRGEDGGIAGLAIFSREITERKQAEHAIRQSQETIRALLNAPTDAALLVDAGASSLPPTRPPRHAWPRTRACPARTRTA